MSSADDTPEELFQYWLFTMDDDLEHFFTTLPADVRSALNYTPSSLDVIERWLLIHYQSIAQIREPGQEKTLDGIARYVGETFRKTLQGGRWRLCNSDPQNVHYGLPELGNFSPSIPPISPYQLVTAAIDRKRGTHLSTILQNMQKLQLSKQQA